jgi:hypothetical protein
LDDVINFRARERETTVLSEICSHGPRGIQTDPNAASYGIGIRQVGSPKMNVRLICLA